jgi:hypothetical protein
MRVLAGLSKEICTLDGEPIRDPPLARPGEGDVEYTARLREAEGGSVVTVKYALAVMLSRAQSKDPARMMNLAHELMHADGDLSLDDADIDAFTTAVHADKLYTNLVKGPVLACLVDTAEAHTAEAQ